MPSSDGFMLVDPREAQQREDEYREAMDKAQRDGGPWPDYPRPTEEQQQFAATVASSETVYRNFTQPSGFASMPVASPPRERPQPMDFSTEPLDESMPARPSFEAGENAVPFANLKDGR